MKTLTKKYPLLILIILLAFTLRLHRLNNPILDWHSWRQADTASVTREYTKRELNPLYPKYHDISNIASGKFNPEGWRMVEFPLYNIITASILKLLPTLPLEGTSRMISILFSLGTLTSIFFLTKSFMGKKAGYLASFFFAVLPYSIFYSRTTLPEPTMLFFNTFSILTFRLFMLNKKTYYFLLSIVSLALALLLKPFVLFLAPVYLWIAWEKEGLKSIKNYQLYLFVILAFIPLFSWRRWISNFPTGIPASDWLFNGNGIRFRPAWFRWLFYERLTKLILGFTGVLLLPVSFINSIQKKDLLIPGWWLSILLYFSVIATGNVQHDYYQVLATPIIAITLANGVLVLDRYLAKKFNPLLSITTLIIIISSMVFFSYQNVKGYFNINNYAHHTAGEAVAKQTPEDALVIAPNFGDTAFLFQTHRWGWPIGSSIEDKIKKGATIYVTTTGDKEAQELEQKYFIIEKTSDYLILDLTKVKEKQQQ